ncbi:MAG TPA: Zn-dependent hydrolase [Kiritimatiellia bacterium]|nr:Zn-dependent hydrolase [Kiritimatiellia bacterium]
MSTLPAPSSKRVIADLKELASLTSTRDGAQRVAWGPVFRKTREWFRKKVKSELGLSVEVDSAGNQWVTLPGKSKDCVLIAGHLDSVPNGGWLDGCLGTLSALEVLRRHKAAGTPPLTLKLVDWADEEGSRFGRSLLGSSAAGGTLKIDEVKNLKDRDGVLLPDALKENGVNLKTMLDAHKQLKKIPAKAYLELHIEQGPVLESMNKPAGIVLGTFGVERHMIRFIGQAAHSGSTPIPMRKDAFLAAAQFALEVREIARRHSRPGANVVCTCGVVKVEPCIVTAVPGVCDLSIDQRALNAKTLAKMFKEAKAAAAKAAKDNNVKHEWSLLWQIEPRLFDKKLIAMGKEALMEITGSAPILPSGPLHDAAEMVPHMPTVMMFAYSSNGLSHCKEEDTPIKHLDATIRAYVLMADKVIAGTSD